MIGVGTAAPSHRLHVSGDNTAAGGYPIVKIENTQPGGHSWWLYSGARAVRFVTNDAHHLVISGAGGVGVGTASPQQRLDVAGGVRVSGNLSVAGTITGGVIEAKYQEVAEWMPSTQELAAGTVVCSTPSGPTTW